MADSLSLITAQISFLHPQLVLVHLPIEYYSFFLQPILRLLFGEDHDEDASGIPWTNRHDFLNISITPTEVSIICHRNLAERFILPIRNHLQVLLGRQFSHGEVEVAKEDYTVIQVDGQGLDAGQRVIELTGPLAMAGISIFFITTYFSDYILVPTKARRTVTMALEQRGFIFSKAADAFISQLSPTLQQSHVRHESSSSTSSGWSPAGDSRPPSSSAPTTPPARDIDELQLRTFRKLRGQNIRPQADLGLRLVSCAGSREADSAMEAQLKDDLLQVLLATQPGCDSRGSLSAHQDVQGSGHATVNGIGEQDCAAHFLSITITSNEPVSILMEERLLQRLGTSLFGAKEAADILIPIIFDLRPLGLETTGIIGGVAGRLSQPGSKRLGHAVAYDDISPKSETFADRVNEEDHIIEVNFLSTAKSGTVVVKASQLQQAMKKLELGYVEIDEGF